MARGVAPVRDFAQRVIDWQRVHGRHSLPWQGSRDPYRLWLAEVMLQQTQVATVATYYERFLATFPDVGALALAPLDRVLAQWSGLGYYRRAHHLHAAARTVMARHGGTFPSDAATLATLPGVGRSTAAAIAAFATGAPHAILDGNVKRVLARHAGIEGWPGAARVEAALWDLAQARLPQRAGDGAIEAYTQGMMDLGAAVCTRASPRCGECPVAHDCVARRTGRTATLPAPRPVKVLPQRAVHVLAIERGGRLLFERRPARGVWGGLWSLPECPLGVDVHDVARSRFGIVTTKTHSLSAFVHVFTHFRLTLHPLRLAAHDAADHGVDPMTAGAAVDAPRSDGIAWWSRADAEAAGLPAPIRRLLRSFDPTAATAATPAS
ncbi:MAG: A/G-specific adenine glycosylase [Burkholderiales bacterium]|nr:A/G-specific adenine glycosylase [Burkholderiales bacterium]